MAMHYKKEIISPEVLQELYPLTPEQKKQKQIRDQQIKEIITGESDKFLVIIGPCSADHEDSVCEYITRLAKVQERIQEKVLIVPRIYTNKPRTTGEGYKGIVHQPDPEKGEDFMEGLIAMRKMHIRSISETGFFAADEMCPLGRRPAAPYDCQRHGCTGRYEKPYQRRFFRYVKFLHRRSVTSYIPVSWL